MKQVKAAFEAQISILVQIFAAIENSLTTSYKLVGNKIGKHELKASSHTLTTLLITS